MAGQGLLQNLSYSYEKVTTKVQSSGVHGSRLRSDEHRPV